MKRPLYAPSIVRLDREGRVLFAQPLQPIAIPALGMRKWNAGIPKWKRRNS